MEQQQQQAREQSVPEDSDVQIVEFGPSSSSSPSKTTNKKGPKKPFHKDQRQKPVYKVRGSHDEQPSSSPKASQSQSWADSPMPTKQPSTATASSSSAASSVAPSNKGESDPKTPVPVPTSAWDADDDLYTEEATLLKELKQLRADRDLIDQQIREREQRLEEVRAAKRK